jgi:hypothetical protein
MKPSLKMHVDGGISGQFFVTPQVLMAGTSDHALPESQLYIIVNTGLERSFKVVQRRAPSILAQAVGNAVKVDARMLLGRRVAREIGLLSVVNCIAAPFPIAVMPSFRFRGHRCRDDLLRP